MAEPNNSSTSTTPRPAASADSARMSTTSGSQRSDTGSQEESTRDSGSGVVDRVKQSATAQLTAQKNRGIDALGSVAQAVRGSTQKLRDDNHDVVASYVDRAADQIEQWSQRVREKDIDELLTDVRRLARRQPAVFIGAAFAAGLIGARFFKSSKPQNDYGYRSDSRRMPYGGSPRMGVAHDRSTSGRLAETGLTSDQDTGRTDVSSMTPTGSGGRAGGSRTARTPTGRS